VPAILAIQGARAVYFADKATPLILRGSGAAWREAENNVPSLAVVQIGPRQGASPLTGASVSPRSGPTASGGSANVQRTSSRSLRLRLLSLSLLRA